MQGPLQVVLIQYVWGMMNDQKIHITNKCISEADSAGPGRTTHQYMILKLD